MKHEFVTKSQNDVYTVRDLVMDKLVLSYIILHAGKQTRGHYHVGQEEVYFFQFGVGEMVIGENKFEVKTGDVVIVPDGEFHRVINTGEVDLVFNTVYNRLENTTTVYAS